MSFSRRPPTVFAEGDVEVEVDDAGEVVGELEVDDAVEGRKPVQEEP
jgi:uncharacterized protein YuzE